MRIWILAIVVALAGCTSLTPAAPAAPPSPVLLAAREAMGGLCRVDAPCGHTLTVLTDGSWELQAFEGRKEGVLTPDRLARLVDAAADTGLAAAPAFTGTCPLAYDGEEVTYRWRDGDRIREVGSCEREVDPADPLAAVLDDLAADLG